MPNDRFEVIVVDDGSTDDTRAVLEAIETPYALRTIHFEHNQGVSAGRNAGMRSATGDVLILLSDDLIVSENFITAHARTLERFPNSWVVGGFTQLDDLEATPFGRFLAGLEAGFDAGRLDASVAPHIWEMSYPTARNLSLPLSDLARVGLFDEQFRVTCEDQDLAERAMTCGIRFLYNDEIQCVHNDHAADLTRYCRFQERGATDTVRLIRKHPDIHGGAPVAQANGPVSGSDPPLLAAKKLVKAALARPGVISRVIGAAGLAERAGVPDRILFRGYKAIIALATFRGWRVGLAEPGPSKDAG